MQRLTGFLVLLLGAALMTGGAAQSPVSSDLLQQRLARNDAQVAQVVHDYPDTARALVTRMYARIAALPAAAASADLSVLRALARTWAAVWDDAFFVHQVDHFARWTPAERQIKVRVDSLRLAGAVALTRSGAGAAIARWRESLSLARSIHDSAGEGAALGNIGIGLWRNGAIDSASWYLARSRALAAAIGDRRTAANALVAEASIARDAGDLATASALYQSAIVAHQRIGDDRGVAAGDNDMGLIARARGDTARARQWFETALRRNRTAGRLSVAADNLVNLANLDVDAGNRAEAASDYAQALAIRRQRGERAGTAPILRDIGLLAMRRSDFDSARATLTAAVAIFDATGPAADDVAARIDLATAESAAGSLQSALETLGIADSVARRTASPDAMARVALARGDLAIEFNAFTEAERDYAAAARRFAAAHDSALSADANQGAAELLLRRHEPKRAREILLAVQRQRAASGDVRAMAQASLLLGYAVAGVGDTTAAERELNDAARTFHRIGDATGEASVSATQGELALGARRLAEAQRFFDRGLVQLAMRPAPDIAFALHDGRSRTLAAGGMLDAAALEMHRAIAIAESEAAGITAIDRRTGFRADKWEIYLRLALLEHQRGRDTAAFAVSDRLRGREMLERYAGVMARVSDPAAGHGPRVDSSAANADAVASRLAPDQALLEYLVTDSTTLAFVIRRDGMRAIDLHIGRRPLAATIDFARETISNGRDLPERRPWLAPLRRLDRLLVEPIERAGALQGVRHLLIAPYAELHYLPFAALVVSDTGAGYLIERYDIAYVPSAAAWLEIANRKSGEGASGVIALAPRPDALPGSLDEVRAIRAIVGASATVLSGPAATVAAFRASAPRYGVVHLATFGVLNQHNPLYSYVELAGSNGGFDRLSVHDLLGITLHARVVVLSACETALASGAEADVPAGDDWTGLVRAVLDAGADNVLATLWSVQDRSTAALMASLYRELVAGRPLSLSLAAAQRAAIRDPHRADPIHWAGFTLAGTGE